MNHQPHRPTFYGIRYEPIQVRPEQPGNVPIHEAISAAESYHAVNSHLQPHTCPLWTPRPKNPVSLLPGAFAAPEPVMRLSGIEKFTFILFGLFLCAYCLLRHCLGRVSLVEVVNAWVILFWSAIVCWFLMWLGV